MSQQDTVQIAIARCDAILANIERIQADLRESTRRTQEALQAAISKLNSGEFNRA